ncbi:FIST N-terminal domain-containing protein [soil metagenome]
MQRFEPNAGSETSAARGRGASEAAARPMGMGAGLSGERPTGIAAREAALRALAELEKSIGQSVLHAGAVQDAEGAGKPTRGGATLGAARSDVDLALVFISPHHIGSAQEALDAVGKVLSPRNMLLASAEAVIGGFLELEGVPGISVLAASLPGVRVHTFSSDDLPMALGVDEEADEKTDLADIAEAVGMLPIESAQPGVGAAAGTQRGQGRNAEASAYRCTILLVDPYTVPITGILPTLSRARSLCAVDGAGQGDADSMSTAGYTGAGGALGKRGAIIGGIASGSMRAGGNVLIVNGRVRHQGLIGVTLSGPIRVDTVVSQGCRAFGPNMVVTRAKGNVIKQLGGRPALTVIREQIEALPEQYRQLLSRGLMLGRVVDEYRDRFGPGDYLIRAVTKVSPELEEVVLADHFKVGQTVRLHLRDAETAERDLAMLMDAQGLYGTPMGALLITCNGRGTRLFSKANHDVTMIQRAFFEPTPGAQKAKGGSSLRTTTGFPLAGFFAAGEIAPVGDRVFLHGHTACGVLFRRV